MERDLLYLAICEVCTVHPGFKLLLGYNWHGYVFVEGSMDASPQLRLV